MFLRQRVHGNGRRDLEILQNLQLRIWQLWTAVGLDSLFPSNRKMDYINNLLCWKTVHEAKCNNICDVIRDLWRKSVTETKSASMDTDPSQPENAGRQMTGRQTPSGKVPLPVMVCILKPPFPASATKTTGVFSLVHFFNVYTFSDEDSVLSYFSLLYPTSAICQNETSNWLKRWKTTRFVPK